MLNSHRHCVAHFYNGHFCIGHFRVRLLRALTFGSHVRVVDLRLDDSVSLTTGALLFDSFDRSRDRQLSHEIASDP